MGEGRDGGKWLPLVINLLKTPPKFQTVESSFAKVITDKRILFIDLHK